MRVFAELDVKKKDKIIKTKTMIGNKYGKLTVVEELQLRDKYRKKHYNCLCDCGNFHSTSGECLRNGKTKSCGCWKKTIPPTNKILNRTDALWFQLYNKTINIRSKNLNIPSDIEFDDFVKLSVDKCHYCGIKNSNTIRDYNRTGIEKKFISDTILKYNGIDRIDSDKGYTKDNAVACCFQCNRAKSDMKQDDFYQLITRIYNYNNLKN